MFIKFPKLLAKSGEVDSLIVFGVHDFDDIINVIEKSGMKIDENLKDVKNLFDNVVLKPIKKLMKKLEMPIFYAGPYPYRFLWNQKFLSEDIPLFSLWDQPTKCLAMLTQYSEYRRKFS